MTIVDNSSEHLALPCRYGEVSPLQIVALIKSFSQTSADFTRLLSLIEQGKLVKRNCDAIAFEIPCGERR